MADFFGCRRHYSFFFVILFFFASLPIESSADSLSYSELFSYSDARGDILFIRVERDISLDELISTSGYRLADGDVVPFLTEFTDLNEGILRISSIEKGTIVKLPLRFLKSTGDGAMKITEPRREIQREFAAPGEIPPAKDALVEPGLNSNALCEIEGEKREITAFSDREKAEKFVSDVGGAGYRLYVCRDSDASGEAVYKVFAKDEVMIAARPDRTGKTAGSAPDGSERISSDIFEKRRRILHPFLSVTAMYTDNVFKTKKEKKSDFITVVSPGIWLAVPHAHERPPLIDSSTISPGGFIIEGFRFEFYRRFQAYLSYQADIELYSRNSSENTVSHLVHGSLSYKLRGGLSFELRDEYVNARDDRGTGVSFEADEYFTNLFDAAVTFEPGTKTRLRVSYTNFLVDYDASPNSFRKRVDNAVSAAVFYRLRPKTSLFAEYRFIDIDYDDDVLSDSREHHLFVGVHLDATAKTSGIIKAGYGLKDFDDRMRGGRDFILEAEVSHRLTPKVTLSIKGWRKTNETNIAGTGYIFSHGITLGYLHRLTARIAGSFNLSYINDRYRGSLVSGTETKDRDDDYYRIALGLRYEIMRWLSADAGYIYSRRESSFAGFDYANNTFYLRLNGSL